MFSTSFYQMQGLHGFVNLMYTAKRNLDNDCDTSFPLTSCLGTGRHCVGCYDYIENIGSL